MVGVIQIEDLPDGLSRKSSLSIRGAECAFFGEHTGVEFWVIDHKDCEEKYSVDLIERLNKRQSTDIADILDKLVGLKGRYKNRF